MTTFKRRDLVKIVTDQQQYIATGYVGRQHKGLGWVLSYDENEDINTQFFVKLFESALEEREYYFNIDGTNAFRLLMLRVTA